MKARGRSFLSFNTPEAIRWMRVWEKAFGRPRHIQFYDPLPAHYAAMPGPEPAPAIDLSYYQASVRAMLRQFQRGETWDCLTSKK